MAFGMHLRALRKARGLSQQEVSYLSDIERSLISKIESGQLNCSISTIRSLARALGIPTKELFNFDEASTDNATEDTSSKQ